MTRAERNRQAAVLIWSSLIVVAVLLLSRRVTGGIDGVSSAWPCVVVSSLMSLLSSVGWMLFRQCGSVEQSLRSVQIAAAVAWLPTCLSGIALLPSDSPLARGWLFGIAALSAVGLALTHTNPTRERGIAVENPSLTRRVSESNRSTESVDRTPTSDRPDVGVRATATELSDLSVFDPVVDDERTDEATTQWMTRQALPDGVDQIEGAIRVPFTSGQKAASIHIPFSPPFAAVPQVECEIVGDEPARWKLSVVYAYGMRVDLKRESSDGEAEIELSYSAICEANSSEAA